MLSEVLLEKLKSLGDSSRISHEDFVLVLSSAKSLVVSIATGVSLKSGDSDTLSSRPEINTGISVVLALIIESSRQDLKLKPYLDQHQFPSSRTDLLLKLQENVKSATLVGLKSIQNQLSRVVDANWSLQYTDKESSSERVGTLDFQVELQTLDTEGKEKPIHFSCDINDMNDLVSQMKEACKHVEHTTSH